MFISTDGLDFPGVMALPATVSPARSTSWAVVFLSENCLIEVVLSQFLSENCRTVAIFV